MPIAIIDPFMGNEVIIMFAVMNPAVDNGPYDPYAPKDFFRSDIYSFAGGEGIARVYGYACTGGFWLTSGFGEAREIVFVPLQDNVWENIALIYNYGSNIFSVKLNNTEIFSGTMTDIFSPFYSMDNAKATFTLYTGSQYAIDELQRKLITVPPPPTPPQITLVNDSYNMSYISNYQTYNSDQGWDPLGTMSGFFDTSIMPANIVSLSGLDAIFGTVPSQTVVSDFSMSDQGWVWEYVIQSSPQPGTVLQVGYFTQAYGPPFDPNTSYGGPLSSYYNSDGLIQGYGSSVNSESWAAGDIIGVIFHSPTAELVFFKNGNYVGTASVSNGGGYAMAGLS